MNYHPYLVKPQALSIFYNLAQAGIKLLPEGCSNDPGFTKTKNFLSTPSSIHTFFPGNKITCSSLLLSALWSQNVNSRKKVITTTQVSLIVNRIFNHLVLQIDLEIFGSSFVAAKCINKII